ncbi:MAG: hypothetical protein JST86_03380 [Bacteroidetes bacterium]|nr:hypothetical protein [Bacteroidota bacterium]
MSKLEKRVKPQKKGDFSSTLTKKSCRLVTEMPDFLKIEIYIGTIIILISFLFIIKVEKKYALPSHLRYFYFYALIALLRSAYTVINGIYLKLPPTVSIIVEDLLALFDFFFWGSFFSRLFIDRINKRVVRITFGVFLTILVTAIILNNLRTNNFKIIAVANLCFVVYCIIYYLDLFKTNPNRNLKSDATFMIVSGLFFYSAVSLPLAPIIDYFKNSNTKFYPLSYAIAGVVNFGIITMYLLIIKGFSCLIRQTKV